MFKITLVSIQKVFMGFSNVFHGFSRVVYTAALVKHVVQVVHYSTDLCINLCIYIHHMGHHSASKLLVLSYKTDSVLTQCTALQCTGTGQGI